VVVSRGSRSIEHLGSARGEAELAALKAAAAERLVAAQAELDLGVAGRPGSAPLPITASRAAHLWDALSRAYEVLGFDKAVGGDEVFRQLVLARIIEPTSKTDSSTDSGLEETGVAAASYPTVNRRLPVFAKTAFRQALSRACADHAALGPASLVLYDVSTLYFETDAADGFREPGFSREDRLDPQITIGLLTDASGFPLSVAAFEGNKAETATMLPVLREFMAAHRLTDVTVVADAGMISEACAIPPPVQPPREPRLLSLRLDTCGSLVALLRFVVGRLVWVGGCIEHGQCGIQYRAGLVAACLARLTHGRGGDGEKFLEYVVR
jgi:Transposase DDE domain